jgi:putative membrane-bound dehydrogenase-like protein
MSKPTWWSAVGLLLAAIVACAALRETTAIGRRDAPGPTPSVDTADPAAPKRLLPQLPLDELLKPTEARSPAEALATFETIPGFHVELVASEPDVASPVAAAFDEDGRLYVAEMRDYPFRPADGEKPLGRVRLLEDKDGDGRFETSHIFADELLWPTGVVPWKQGVFVVAAPNIYYLKDTDGDGRADERRVVFRGFGVQNEQGSVNNLAWGLDGRIYASASKNGGRIESMDDSQAEPVTLGGRDFCFDPASGKLELVTGGGQFGNAFDDWGDRFLCDESDPSIVVMLPYRYLARAPLLAVPEAVDDLAPGVTPSFRISPLEGWRVVRSTRRLALGERSPNSSGLSHNVLDGVAGVMIYRGDAYPSEFRGSLIVGDGQSNLIHRRRLEPNGVSFRSIRADEQTEFVRSRDNWFRPVNAINAPDGAIYVTDMGRAVIESVHVPWDVVGKIDLTLGRDRGRIYRIAPDGFRLPASPRLSKASTSELVATLAHAGGWWRDTAQRLLVERNDPDAIEQNPLARLHALYTLSQLRALASDDLLQGLRDAHPGVRRHAVLLSEPALKKSTEFSDDAAPLVDAIFALAEDADAKVRFQVAFSLGELPRDPVNNARAAKGLAKIAWLDGNNIWTRTAILTSAARFPNELLSALIDLREARTGQTGAEMTQMLRQAAFLVGRDKEHGQPAPLVEMLAAGNPQPLDDAVLRPILLGLSEGLRGAESSVSQIRPALSEQGSAVINGAVQRALQTAADREASPAERTQAIQILACGEYQNVSQALAALLTPHETEAAQCAAVQTLATFDSPEVAKTLVAPWRQYTPGVRDAVLQALFARPAWLEQFIAAIEQDKVAVGHVGRVHRGMLLAHRDPDLRRRAEKLFETDVSPRAEVYESYKPALQLTGDSHAGEKIYERECMACHQIGAKGQAVGPNLALTKHRTPEELLLHIVDPNREVQPAFLQYTVVDTSGRVFTGLIAADTATSITLRRDKGVEETILKQDIEELVSSAKSLMPEGIEKSIPSQQMADLLAFLRELHYDIGTQPGRRPAEE